MDEIALRATLTTHGQDHLLYGLETMALAERTAWLERLAAVDWEELAHPFVPPTTAELGRSRVLTLADRDGQGEVLAREGEAAFAAGKVAVLMVAGGMGTRLGYDGPKGCYRAGAVSGRSIYHLQTEKVLALSRRLGRPVPFLVMTSPATDAITRRSFAEQDYFGLDPDQVRFFRQGTVPSLDADGRVLQAAPGRLVENPDGHGGCFQALVSSGQLARLVAEGIEHLIYLQVDNLLAPVDDPVQVGCALAAGVDVVVKVLEKVHPDEKLGHLVSCGGRDCIVEYTDLSPAQTRQRDTAGEVVYRWGSPAMLCWRVGFLAGLAATGHRLPLHRSKKPLTAWRDGEVMTVTGWKCERFIFDLLPAAEQVIGLEICRADEFAPIKNATGEDSVPSAQRLVSDQACRWLRAAGVTVDLPADAHVEIAAGYAATAAQLQARTDLPTAVTGDLFLAEA